MAFLEESFARRDDFRACQVTITARVHNVGSREQFAVSQSNRIVATLLPQMVREQILAERPAAQVARDQERGVAVLNAEERAEAARRVRAQMDELRGPVDIVMTNLKRDGNDALAAPLAALQERGIELSDSHLHVEAVAPQFDGLDALEQSFQARTFGGKLKRLLGLVPPPTPPPAPYIGLRLTACLHGPEGMLREAAEELRVAFSGVAREESFNTEIVESPFRVQPDAEPYVPYTLLIDSRAPLPDRGQAVMAGLDAVSTALKAEDAPGAFSAAASFVALLRRDPDVATLLTSNPEFPHAKREVFPETNARSLTRGLEKRLSAMARDGNTDALCDLFFELAPAGVVQTLTSTLGLAQAGYRPGKHYETAARSVFAEPKNALLHFSAVERDENFPVPKRLQQLHVHHERQLQSFGEALNEATTASPEHMGAEDEKASDASIPAPR